MDVFTGKPLPPDDSRGGTVVAAQAPFLAIALILVGIRLYVRRFVVRALGWDDFWMVLATLHAIVLFVFSIIALKHGAGRHLVYLQFNDLAINAKLLKIGELLFLTGTGCARISIAIFILRVLAVERKWRRMLKAFIIFMAVVYIAWFIEFWFVCRPVKAQWQLLGREQYCMKPAIENGINMAGGIFGVVMDFVVASLPVLFLWDVQIDRKKKIGIICLMSLGFLTGAIGIVRTVQQVHFINNIGAVDPTYDAINLSIWAAIESLFLIIGGTIPAIQPVMGMLKRKKRFVGTSDLEQRSGSGATPLKRSRDPYDTSFAGQSTVTGDADEDSINGGFGDKNTLVSYETPEMTTEAQIEKAMASASDTSWYKEG